MWFLLLLLLHYVQSLIFIWVFGSFGLAMILYDSHGVEMFMSVSFVLSSDSVGAVRMKLLHSVPTSSDFVFVFSSFIFCFTYFRFGWINTACAPVAKGNIEKHKYGYIYISVTLNWIYIKYIYIHINIIIFHSLL